MAKAKRKPELCFEGLMPTPEQAEAFAETWQIADGNRARAYRRTPVIETLKLSARQHAALAHYRDICEDKSPQRDSLDKALHGRLNGTGVPHITMRRTELEYLNEALGNLWSTIYAIAVQDKTPSQHAMDCFGSVTEREQRGKWVITRFKPKRLALRLVQDEISDGANALADAMGI